MKKLIACILFIILAIIFLIINKNVRNEEYVESNMENTDILYNELTHEYYILDSEGEILFTSTNKENLYIYEKDPNYNPRIPVED